MAKTADEINADLKRLLGYAQDIQNLANKMGSIITNEYSESVRQLGTNWAGENGALMAQKAVNVGNDTAQNIQKLGECAKTVADIAKNLAVAEAKAAGLNVSV